jgi:Arc/MetJ family transcription regulator
MLYFIHMRTNIEIDDAAMAELLERTGLKTKREVVDHALKRLLQLERQKDIRQLRGIGWEGDLDKMRRDA